MQKISSFASPILRRVLPIVALGGGAAFVLGAALPIYEPTIAGALLRLASVGAGVVLLFEARLAWRLADEVFDDGDALIVRRKGVEVRIPLADIVGFETGFSLICFNRAIIALTLREETPLGRRIIILTYYLWLHQLQGNPISDDLYARAERARKS